MKARLMLGLDLDLDSGSGYSRELELAEVAELHEEVEPFYIYFQCCYLLSNGKNKQINNKNAIKLMHKARYKD